MKPILDSQTERALAVFDAFLVEWIPRGLQEQMFGHGRNLADPVRNAIRGIVDQGALPLRMGPLGYVVLRQDPIFNNRDYRNGFCYEPVSPVFENPIQGENSLDGFRRRRPGLHVLGEVRDFHRG